MAKYECDVCVIGSGPGGYVAALRAAQLGLKTVCIEKSKTVGGTCLNVGCIPSKALLQSSEHYDWLLKESALHGIAFKDPSFNFEQMQLRKDQVVKSLVDSVANAFKQKKVTRLEGIAKFTSTEALTVNGDEVRSKNFILATGSEPIPLPFLPFDEKKVVSSTGALALGRVPKTMLVIGAGVIGVELASVYRRLGTDVTIVEMLDMICTAMDLTISKALLQILKKQGLVFHLETKVTAAKKDNGGVALSILKEGKELLLKAEVVLVAVGRRPYSSGLGLSEIGVAMNARGFVDVDANFQTSVPHIYAIGDLIDGPMLAHRASDEGVAVAEIIGGVKPQRVNYMSVPNVIYTQPEAAAVGLTEKEAAALGLKTKSGTAFFKGNARARCSGYTEGLVKVIGEEDSGRLVGLHILGPHASEMIGEGVLALAKNATLAEIAAASHAHPSLCESIKDAALAGLGPDVATLS